MSNPKSEHQSRDAERRNAQRVGASCKCWIERESCTLMGTVVNISQGGLFMVTPVLVSKGSGVKMELTLGDDIITAHGHVVWVGAKSTTSRSGLGIRFDNLGDQQDVLGKYIERNKKLAIIDYETIESLS